MSIDIVALRYFVSVANNRNVSRADVAPLA
jgi:DNA-binding transcriptional LysR family regulator